MDWKKLKSDENDTEGVQIFSFLHNVGNFFLFRVEMLARGCHDRSVSFHIYVFSHWEKAFELYMHIQVYWMDMAEEEFQDRKSVV